ncbi:hypothetical protein [Streptomyces sp. NPDC060002]|uniref:hypothetical protein n=1 Tax=Streptomyces sp. NPDC060002 TaxID=3347033 RepID=UPI0036BE1D72
MAVDLRPTVNRPTVNRSTVTWDLEIDFVTAGKLRTVTLSGKDHFLRTTGLNGAPAALRAPGGYRSAEHYRTRAYIGMHQLHFHGEQPAVGP